MRPFPRRVRRYRGKQALKVGCNACGVTFTAEVETLMRVQEASGQCPACEKYALEVAYIEVDSCKGCGRFLEEPQTLGLVGFCSARCKLQHEWYVECRTRIKREIFPLPWTGYAGVYESEG